MKAKSYLVTRYAVTLSRRHPKMQHSIIHLDSPLLSLSFTERLDLIAFLKQVLITHPQIQFAYLYGSLLKDRPFHDIDIGIYLEKEK